MVAALFAGMVAGCFFLVDRQAAVWARGLDPLVVAIFWKITVLGSATPYLIGLALLYPALRFSLRREAAAQRALFVLVAIVVSGLTADLLKPLVARWRPVALFSEPAQYGFALFKSGEMNYSFPSGHATTACAVACALTLLFPGLRALWIVVAALVAASRIVIGAHFPGDVLAGVWLGVVITLALSRTPWFREVLEKPGGWAGERSQGTRP